VLICHLFSSRPDAATEYTTEDTPFTAAFRIGHSTSKAEPAIFG
jgi:hypothetical protein